MEILLKIFLLLSPVVLLALFIVSLVSFLRSPKGTKDRKIWKIFTIVFGVIIAAIILYIIVIMIMMMMVVRYM